MNHQPSKIQSLIIMEVLHSLTTKPDTLVTNLLILDLGSTIISGAYLDNWLNLRQYSFTIIEPCLKFTKSSTIASLISYEKNLSPNYEDSPTVGMGVSYNRQPHMSYMEYQRLKPPLVGASYSLPGSALVDFNHELLQALSKVSALRIYCAGVWHNAVLCAVCAWALLLQPFILYPFCIHDEGPMIISLDDIRINNAQEWSQIIAALFEHSHQNTQNHSLLENSLKRSVGKGYCIPSSLVEEDKYLSLEGNGASRPDELSAFITNPCLDQAMAEDDNLEVSHQRDGGELHCFYAKDVLKLEKCGDGWGRLHSNRSSC
ncbi:putative replication factor C subunit 3-like [Capsicum annuum]|nr:putative replication factor C subunit 3-like [Capsicum annuum]